MDNVLVLHVYAHVHLPSFQRLLKAPLDYQCLPHKQQLQRQVNAAADSDTVLARLLAEEADDGQAIERLFQSVLARRATPREVELSLSHVKSVVDRDQAFEDVLWGLLNSAEFTSRR